MVVFVPLTYIYYPDGERDLTLMKVNVNVRFLTFNECVCEGSWRVCTRRVFGVSRGLRSTCRVIVTSTFREANVNRG